MIVLSRLLLAWRDIGIRFSVRSFVRSSVRPFVLQSVNIWVNANFDLNVQVYHPRTIKATVMILGISLHIRMTTQTALSLFDLDLYCTAHRLCKFASTAPSQARHSLRRNYCSTCYGLHAVVQPLHPHYLPRPTLSWIAGLRPQLFFHYLSLQRPLGKKLLTTLQSMHTFFCLCHHFLPSNLSTLHMTMTSSFSCCRLSK